MSGESPQRLERDQSRGGSSRSGLLTKANVQEGIAARTQEAQVEANEVIGTLASHLRRDITDVLDHPILANICNRGLGHLIKTITICEGSPKNRFGARSASRKF